jgi:superfamily II DNA or RNA helicase
MNSCTQNLCFHQVAQTMGRIPLLCLLNECSRDKPVNLGTRDRALNLRYYSVIKYGTENSRSGCSCAHIVEHPHILMKRRRECAPTTEQQGVIDAVVSGFNVRVMAVPGAGKTFTMERIASALRLAGKHVLCLTYSSRLKMEWRQKNPVHKSDIHSFHSLACRLYPGQSVHNDTDLYKLLQGTTPTTMHTRYDAVLLDEAQDMCSLHYELLRAHYQGLQLVVMGQIRQCVFEYKNNEHTRASGKKRY